MDGMLIELLDAVNVVGWVAAAAVCVMVRALADAAIVRMALRDAGAYHTEIVDALLQTALVSAPARWWLRRHR